MAQPGDKAVSPDFTQRVKRIEKKHRRDKRKKPRVRSQSSLAYVASLIAAVVVGYLVIIAARYARFHLTGMLPGETGVDMAGLGMELALAMMASLVLSMIFDFKSPEHAGAKGMGIVIAIFTMHMWVHGFPETFAFLFSEAWVNRVVWLTDPSTLAAF